MDNPQPSTSKKPYKRKMTEKRRDQNRAAQKMYRLKRKERLERLERQVSAMNEHMGLDHGESTPESTSESLGPQNAHADLGDKRPANSATSTSLHSKDFTVVELRRLIEVNDSESALLLEFAVREKPDIKQILLAGLQALKLASEQTTSNPAPKGDSISSSSSLSEPIYTPPSLLPNFAQMLPDLLTNGIFLRHQHIVDVFHHNSQKIGLQLSQLTTSTAQSPWYSPLSLPTSLVPLESIPPDLVPTPAQRQLPHHPFFDVIPFPWLRERAILLDALDPPPYSRQELKADIVNGGVVCWKSRAGREGLPWDRRCWEVSPWFMGKWGWLVEDGGDVERQSRWWRGLRES